ncbi:hypothetical protein [Alkaliphilus oremlandii]|uniref:Lipoprotein n=1 Tax=Alkaliphilus oremlandii (strain OhILAs) TaxID=350688 RepID=A8MGJ7_ALKOO|nr:hypothetical protein [Alkaliphilus oremlandii]ABW19220.1 hypothetical protein Clos_1680 [Alkaliphilus oremlandii OhILAs]
MKKRGLCSSKKMLIITIFYLIIFSFMGCTSQEREDSKELSSKNEILKVDEAIEIYSYEELATLPLEKTYDYESVLKDMELNGSDTEERKANFKAHHDDNSRLIIPNSTTTVRYAKLAMDSYKFTNLLKKYELTPVLYIGLYYTSVNSPDKIVSINDPFIKTSSGADCIFTNGNIFYRLESGNSFYYGVNGDVYKTKGNTIIKNIDFDGRYYSSSLNSN